MIWEAAQNNIFYLLVLLWTQMDQGLQINQSITYYQHAFNNNYTIQYSKFQYSNTTNDIYSQRASPSYFYAIVVLWMGSPTLSALYIYFKKDFLFDTLPDFLLTLWAYIRFPAVIWKWCYELIMKAFNPDDEWSGEWKLVLVGCLFGCFSGCLCIFPFLIVMPIMILMMIPIYYIYLPIVRLGLACQFCFQLDEFDGDKEGGNYRKLHLETIGSILIVDGGEVIPKLILATVFAVNNYPYLLEHEDYLEIGLPITVISCIFSSGSAVLVLINGIGKIWYLLWNLGMFYMS